MAEMSILQKAACEACWRALRDRDVDRTGQLLTRRVPQSEARARIVEFVRVAPLTMLPGLVMPEVTNFGPLQGGYSRRWQGRSQVGIDYDARQVEIMDDRASRRVSELPAWPEISDSSSGHKGSSMDDDATPKAHPAPGGSTTSGSTVGYFGAQTGKS